MKNAPRATLFLTVLLASSTLHADGDRPVKQGQDLRPVLAKLFETARESGALKRVLGERYYHYVRSGGDEKVLVTVKGSLDDPESPTSYRCDVELRTQGGMREETTTFTCDVALTGEIQRLSFRLVRGRARIESEGAVQDGKLRLTVRSTQGGEPSTESKELSWGPDVLPFSLAVFVIPALCDQGLPEALTFRAFHHARLQANRSTSELTVSTLGGVRTLSMTQFVLMQPPVTVTVAEGGVLKEIQLAEHDRLAPISADEAARLRGDAD